MSMDCDGLDPAVFPAVLAPTPGGLTYQQVIDLLYGLSSKGRIVGFDLMEFASLR